MAGHTNWREVRKKAASADPDFEQAVARERRTVDFETRLHELRERRGVRQGDVAGELGVSQANVSRVEHEQDVRVSTLERYVTALGGRLEVRAIFDDDDVVLIGDAGGASVDKDPPGSE